MSLNYYVLVAFGQRPYVFLEDLTIKFLYSRVCLCIYLYVVTGIINFIHSYSFQLSDLPSKDYNKIHKCRCLIR